MRPVITSSIPEPSLRSHWMPPLRMHGKRQNVERKPRQQLDKSGKLSRIKPKLCQNPRGIDAGQYRCAYDSIDF